MEIRTYDHLALRAEQKIFSAINKDEKIIYSNKIEKFNDVGKNQERILIITETALLNVRETTLLEILKGKYEVKRRINLDKIVGISVSIISQEFVIHVKDEHDYRYQCEEKNRIELLEVIITQYFLVSEFKTINCYFLKQKDLSTIKTTEQDVAVKYQRKPKGVTQITSWLDFQEAYFNSQEENAMQSQQFIYHQLTIKDDFTILKTLGSGSFAKVFLVEKNDSKEILALKCIRKSKIVETQSFEKILAEKRILQKIKNPFIITLKYAFQSDSKLYLAMPYLNGGELTSLLQKKELSEELIKFFASEIIVALEYLHEMNIIYRDLKPENIMIDKFGHIRLVDFGISRDLKFASKTKTIIGTFSYLGYNYNL